MLFYFHWEDVWIFAKQEKNYPLMLNLVMFSRPVTVFLELGLGQECLFISKDSGSFLSGWLNNSDGLITCVPNGSMATYSVKIHQTVRVAWNSLLVIVNILYILFNHLNFDRTKSSTFIQRKFSNKTHNCS